MLLCRAVALRIDGERRQAMKIYLLLMLMAVFVAYSYPSLRGGAKPQNATPPDSLPA
jgi:hypothetical protein